MSSSVGSPSSPGISPSLHEQHSIPLAGLYKRLLLLDRGGYGADDPAVCNTGAAGIGCRGAKTGRPPGGNGYHRRPGQKSRDAYVPRRRKPKTGAFP